MFIDETWASTNMARRYGRALRGQRLRVGVPHGHWKTTTFVAGLRASGLVAPFVLDGPINRNAFETYVARVLVPDLRPGDVVVMDNLSSHKGPRVREMIEVAGARLLTPQRGLLPASLRSGQHLESDSNLKIKLSPACFPDQLNNVHHLQRPRIKPDGDKL